MENQDPIQVLAETAEEQAVSRLLNGLERVEAPGDFEFRVRAGIAAGRPSMTVASWLPAAARVAIPLLLLVLVGAYFGTGLFDTAQAPETPFVAEAGPAAEPVTQQPQPTLAAEQPASLIAESLPLTPAETDKRIAGPTVERRVAAPVRPVNDTSGGGSFVEAVRESVRIRPRGFNTDGALPSNANVADDNATIQASTILEFIGINAKYTSAGWRVESVKANNMAGRSGVKAGDVIEAINDQAISEKTAFGNKFTGKSLRVRRDGKSIEIKLGR